MDHDMDASRLEEVQEAAHGSPISEATGQPGLLSGPASADRHQEAATWHFEYKGTLMRIILSNMCVCTYPQVEGKLHMSFFLRNKQLIVTCPGSSMCRRVRFTFHKPLLTDRKH